MFNRIITQGFGPRNPLAPEQSSGIVVRGYGPTFVAPAADRPARLRLGQSGTKRRLEQLDDAIVWARLLTVNDVEPKRDIRGWVHVRVSKGNYAAASAEHLFTRIRPLAGTMAVTAERLDAQPVRRN